MLLSKCLQGKEKPSKQTFSKTLLMEACVLGLTFWYIMLSYLNNNINFHISVFFGTAPATRINEQFSKFTCRRRVRQPTAIFLGMDIFQMKY